METEIKTEAETETETGTGIEMESKAESGRGPELRGFSEPESECGCGRRAAPKVSAKLSPGDVLAAWKARWGIGRRASSVRPGLYRVGEPAGDSPVIVSANYRLTFDIVRRSLAGMDCWLLLLDTRGINVWCAAGKGSFGTDELVSRMESAGLSEIVSHRKIILPQLGAPGVNAHEVERRTGFSVLFGPVRAADIQAYVASGFVATREMRKVRFNFADRLALVPMEILPAAKKALPVMGAALVTNQFASRPFGKADLAACAGAILSGGGAVPLLLPYIPGRAFAWKGWLAGLCGTAGVLKLSGGFAKENRLMSAGQLLFFPALSSYLAMNFTGASTYASPSGVKKEMKHALPLMLVAGAAGAAIMLGSHFFGKRRRP